MEMFDWELFWLISLFMFLFGFLFSEIVTGYTISGHILWLIALTFIFGIGLGVLIGLEIQIGVHGE